MNDAKRPAPDYLWSMITMKCPRCRCGQMFKDNNPYTNLRLSHIFNMYEACPECAQKFDLEPGFWYGTGYVSYGLAVAISGITFAAWYVLIGISTEDNRIFWWLGLNSVLLIVVQPWLMRLSRSMYIRFFLKYDPDYEKTSIQKFDY